MLQVVPLSLVCDVHLNFSCDAASKNALNVFLADGVHTVLSVYQHLNLQLQEV